MPDTPESLTAARAARYAALREAADLIEADLIPTPIDEAEEHVNNVLGDLARRLRHLADGGEDR